jgi:hypothetical protein
MWCLSLGNPARDFAIFFLWEAQLIWALQIEPELRACALVTGEHDVHRAHRHTLLGKIPDIVCFLQVFGVLERKMQAFVRLSENVSIEGANSQPRLHVT